MGERGSDDQALPTDDELKAIEQALHGLRFGSVSVVVQDGVVVQIERTEKRRLRTAPGKSRIESTT